METLVIIALHQPITRPEIEDIRGASLAQQTMDSLLEAGLIEAQGRKESAGRPTLWGTTSLFLSRFGLGSLHDLPGAHLLPAPLRPASAKPAAANESPVLDAPAPSLPAGAAPGLPE